MPGQVWVRKLIEKRSSSHAASAPPSRQLSSPSTGLLLRPCSIRSGRCTSTHAEADHGVTRRNRRCAWKQLRNQCRHRTTCIGKLARFERVQTHTSGSDGPGTCQALHLRRGFTAPKVAHTKLPSRGLAPCTHCDVRFRRTRVLWSFGSLVLAENVTCGRIAQ